MKKPVKKMVKRRYAEGGITERTFGEDEPVQSRFGSHMLEKARMYAKMKESGELSDVAPKPAARAKAAPKPVETPVAKPVAKPAAPAPKPMARDEEAPKTASKVDEEPAYRKGTLEDPEYRKKLEKEQALERVNPEEYLIGGPLKPLSVGAKALAGKIAGERAAKVAMQKAGERAAQNRAGKAEARELMERAKERSADVVAAERRAAARKAPEKPAPRDLDEERMSGEGGAFRKGGSVRGCGIARKGLTKGKMR